jgi:hypothetical protein
MYTVHGVTPTPAPIPRCALIVGPSQAGKTRALNAIMGALADVGLDGGAYPTHLIPVGGEVSVTDDAGGLLYRRTPGKRYAGPAKSDRVVTIASPVVLAAALASTAPSAARDVADRLDAIIPGASAADLIAAFVEPGEPTTEKGAEAHRRTANANADHARGTLDETTRSLASAEADARAIAAPDEAKTAAARAYLAALSDALEARQRHQGLAQAYEAAKTQAARWDARQMPQKPAKPRPEGKAPTVPHRPELVLPDEPSDEAPRTAYNAVRLQEATRPRPPALATVPAEAPCSAFKGCTLADGRAATVAANEAAQAQHEADLAAWTARLDKAKAEHTAAVDLHAEAMSAHLAACEAARAAHTKARAEHEAVENAAILHAAAVREWDAYDAAVAARGERPEVPEDPGPAPTVDDQHVYRARERVLESDTYAARKADADKRVAQARQRHDEATARVSAAAAASLRAEELLAYIRRAPALALQDRVAALHVHLPREIVVVVDEAGGASVTVDGLPFRCASSGRALWASAHLRAALRATSSELADVPVLVDGVQAWSGDLDIPGPFVFTSTRAGGELAVVDLAPVATTNDAPSGDEGLPF